MAERGKTGTHVYGSAAENQDGLIFFGKRRYNSLIKKKRWIWIQKGGYRWPMLRKMQ